MMLGIASRARLSNKEFAPAASRRLHPIESLEARLLFSETATAQITLLSEDDSGPAPVYNYDIVVNNTGTTNVGTFWLAWQPGQDFLATTPTLTSSPNGWHTTVGGPGNSTDGVSIQWTSASSSNYIVPGQSLGGFDFTSADSLDVLAADSVSHPGTPTLTSFVYSGAPFSDAGYTFVVAGSAAGSTIGTSTTLAPATANISSGVPITVTATVSPGGSSGSPATGQVTFVEDGATLGGVALGADGTASFTISSLPTGTDDIIANYTGDGSYAASASAPSVIIVGSPAVGTTASTTTLAASSPTAALGANVDFTATITSSVAGGASPSGSVNFFDNGTLLGLATVNGGGVAVFETAALGLGSHNITASYSGDGAYAASDSTSVAQSIFTPVLVPTLGKSTIGTSAVAGQKSRGAVTVTVANQAQTPTRGRIAVSLYATIGGVITADSFLIGSAKKTVNLGVGKSTPVMVHANAEFAQLQTNDYTLVARVVDPNSQTVDAGAGPTLTVAAPFIALSETFAKLTLPASVAASSTSHATAVVKIANAGNIISVGKTTIGIYASTDGTIGAASTLIRSITPSPHIRAGKSIMASIGLKKIPALTPGTYKIVVQVTDPKAQTSTAVAASTIIVT